jgi:hypothetical protein
MPYSLVKVPKFKEEPATSLFWLEKVYVSVSVAVWERSLMVCYPEY